MLQKWGAYQAGFYAKKSLVGSYSFATAKGRVNTRVDLPQLHLSSLRDSQKVRKDQQHTFGGGVLPHSSQGSSHQLTSHGLHCGATAVWRLMEGLRS